MQRTRSPTSLPPAGAVAWTGCPNRALFDDELARFAAEVRSGTALAIIEGVHGLPLAASSASPNCWTSWARRITAAGDGVELATGLDVRTGGRGAARGAFTDGPGDLRLDGSLRAPAAGGQRAAALHQRPLTPP